MTIYQLNLSTSLNLQSDTTNYVFAHDPENPSNKLLFDWLKKQKGAYYALNGHTETGEPANAIVELKRSSNEDTIETHFMGVELYKVLKFDEKAFKITLHCISLNEHSKMDNNWGYEAHFESNHKPKPKTMRFVSICGKNDEFYLKASSKLINLGYHVLEYKVGYLFYCYDELSFTNFKINQQMSFLFTIVFNFNQVKQIN